MYDYLDTLDVDRDAMDRIERYLDLIRCRADGKWNRFSKENGLIPLFVRIAPHSGDLDEKFYSKSSRLQT